MVIIDELLDSLHIFEKKLLINLSNNLSLSKAVELTKMPEIQVLKAAQWLSNKELVIIKESKKKAVSLTLRGEEVREKGLPEIRLLTELNLSDKKMNEISSLDKNEFNKALGVCRKEGLLSILNGLLKITSIGKEYLNKEEKKKFFLESLKQKEVNLKDLKISENDLKELIDRGLILLIDRTEWEFSTTPLGLQLIKKGINMDEELLERTSSSL
ncbi:MAG: hypothetical protein PHN56_03705, partial [Candidatus Nanoarchaeia archaeon]|nr:hypothetical protein [Candidatus Nanoarchaeia archaeon]